MQHCPRCRRMASGAVLCPGHGVGENQLFPFRSLIYQALPGPSHITNMSVRGEGRRVPCIDEEAQKGEVAGPGSQSQSGAEPAYDLGSG